ncbi:hypothetical protein ABK040_003288 [Willaertia magna]
MSEQRKFIDETGKVKRKQKETVLMKIALKDNQKKGRVRRVLKNKRLLQNYFEFSSKMPATCSNNPTLQFEVKNLSDGHDFVSCTLVSNQTKDNKQEECLRENSSDLQTDCPLNNDPEFQSTETCNSFTNSFTNITNATNQQQDNLCSQNCKGLILVSEHFHLQLDVEDFIASYRALSRNTRFSNVNL